MFYYYGRKKQLARHYPPPEFDCIVEPFAGAAAYSLHGNHWKKSVLLCEKDERVAQIWRWLIDEATPDKIRALPSLRVGEKSSEFFHIIHAVSKMAFHYKTITVTPVLERNWEISKRVMAANVHKIKHWTLHQGEYTDAPDIEATWFIDPPYKSDAGLGYAHGSDLIDYERLAQWVHSRRGQLICCEGEEGDYLPFEPLIQGAGVAGKKNTERIFHRSGLPGHGRR